MEPSLAKLKVLVVDDNQHMTSIVKTILRGFGVKDSFEAHNADDALDLLRSQPVDLIVLDYAMDPVDGPQLARMIRTGPESSHTFAPIIMLTAYAEKSKVEAARDAGVTEFCAKPVSAAELYRKVRVAINAPRSFIRTPLYFGPDRRRRDDVSYDGKERRESLFGPKSGSKS
jgi:two-component system, chemotaxis family, chemotaxis protein CheY